jgi:putative transcriptional regulator
MTLAEIKAQRPTINRAKIAATTEDDIRRHAVEDGQNPDASLPTQATIDYPPAMVREALKMTQMEFADKLGIPVATLRNWEQGRVALDPAVRALMRILMRAPKAALKALA